MAKRNRFGWRDVCLAAACTLATLYTSRASADAVGPYKHVLIVSIDGLHQADLDDPALADAMPNLHALRKQGVSYTHASTTSPSDSFPGTLAYLTGAGPATTGIYYDEGVDRTLTGADGKKPVLMPWTEAIDKNADLLTAGGNDFGTGGIDAALLPHDPANGNAAVWPHQSLKVNTILELAHDAGLRTALTDKHPSYEIANGPSGKGIDDFYAPEISAKAALVDGKLVDASAPNHPDELSAITKHVELVSAYDDLKLNAVLNTLKGDDFRGTAHPGVPAIVVMNLQAVNVGEKIKTGGIDLADGKEQPSEHLIAALKHTDGAIGKLVDEIKADGLSNDTLLIVTAKHGQDPRVGAAKIWKSDVVPGALKAAGIDVFRATQDDGAVIWLADPAQAAAAAKVLQGLKTADGGLPIDAVMYGDALGSAGAAGDPTRTPDLVVTLQPGNTISDKPKRAEHGGFAIDDALHVPLIVVGGQMPAAVRGTTQDAPVATKQIAVTAVEALGLDAKKLQGAVAEHTPSLPGTGVSTVAAR